MHIRRDDMVEVVTGDDARTQTSRVIAKVLRVIPSKNKVVVEGVNRAYKHLRPNRQNPQGGRLSKEMPVSASNVLLFCDRCARGVRIGYKYDSDGAKERICRKCSKSLGTISPPRSTYAKRT